jgi:hypothetical protein
MEGLGRRASGVGLMYDHPVFDLAKEEWGTTDNPYAAGYILPDGSMLDMSQGQGERVSDHREVEQFFDPEYAERWQPMVRFMEEGAIRMSGHQRDKALFLDYVRRPTDAQDATIRELTGWFEEVTVERTNPNTGTAEVWNEWGTPGKARLHPASVIRWMDETGLRGLGQPLGPRSTCGGITWRRVSDSIGELKRLYTGLPLPGKPKVKKKCAWALEAALGKFEEALDYRSRGACGESEEYAIDAIRYHGIFLGCQTEKKKKKRKKKR